MHLEFSICLNCRGIGADGFEPPRVSLRPPHLSVARMAGASWAPRGKPVWWSTLPLQNRSRDLTTAARVPWARPPASSSSARQAVPPGRGLPRSFPLGIRPNMQRIM